MSELLTHEIRGARIAGPLSFDADGGAQRELPHGPCLIERLDGERVEIIWGNSGEHSAVLPLSALVHAEQRGSLVLLN